MTIHLPKDVENSINEAVLSGRFASMDAAMTEAAQLLLQKLRHGPVGAHTPCARKETPDFLLGSMSDHAELMDQIVEDAMRNREQQPWRLSTSE